MARVTEAEEDLWADAASWEQGGSEQDVARTTASVVDSATARQGDPVALQAALDSRVKLLRAENEQLERELADSRQV